MALELDYIPMPKATVDLIRASWGEMKDAAGKAVYSAK
jgi:phosphate transport system substrate-binding protein